ncbi:intraflagellar transport protein 43 homolog [Agrilus planipennis]|uniref:Intraflagellar transport protein 43 homolog n=1 Tax=Agrilus planipennis TaxID=224129 RepID=A0A1W4W6Y5_AGRPL|nr:intraflagellar transport protein 43 homolog [Agrilus planipennis]
MDWGEDSNLLGFSRKKRSANKNNDKENLTSKQQDGSPEINLNSKRGGWAEEGIKLKNKSKTNFIDQDRFKTYKIDDSDDDIPVIPDIEELQDEPMENKSLKSHLLAVNTSTYQELDFELSTEGNSPLSQAKLKTKNGDISLNFLAKHLHLEKDIKEADISWSMDSLWSDICKFDGIK